MTSNNNEILTEFEKGYLCAMAQLIRLHDMPSMAASCLRGDGLDSLDCSELDEFDKAPLRELLKERGIAFTGLGLRRVKTSGSAE